MVTSTSTSKKTSKTKAKPATKSATKPATKPAITKKASLKKSNSPEAIAMLRADHKLVNGLFADYENTRSASKKKKLVTEICNELTVHAQVEEEIFYPAFQKALKDRELVPEATVEHATLKDLIAQVKDVEPVGDMFDAKIKVMSEYVKHHVKEEQKEMFPKAKATKLDMHKLGAQMEARKKELMAAIK